MKTCRGVGADLPPETVGQLVGGIKEENGNMEVRVATIDDANDLFALNTLFVNATTIDLLKKSLMEKGREIVCIAFINDVPVGYCSGLIVKSMLYDENRAEIEALYVREDCRRQGVGEALMHCLEKELIAHGICHFHISTYADNKNAQLLYGKLGYAKTGEILMDKSIK